MSEDNDTFSSTLLPILRKTVPTMLASHIVGVQPMTGNSGQIFTMKGGMAIQKPFYVVECDEVGLIGLMVTLPVLEWLEQFSNDQWTRIEDTKIVTVTEELFTLLALKWSSE
jgi:hypothetical protein